MREYSKVYKVGHRLFRYNYSTATLECVIKETAKRKAENDEWLQEFGEPIWEFENGYAVMDSIGLSRDSWKESPEYWCEVYNGDLAEELAWQSYLFEKYEMPNYI